MVEGIPVLRLTQEAYDTLRSEAQNNHQLYLDPNANFDQLLLDKGITEYTEETGIVSSRLIELSPADSSSFPHEADRQALGFYMMLGGLTPRAATDGRMWAWMTHFELHSYSLKRWRRQKSANLSNYFLSHWFVQNQADALWDSNTAARTWWISHTAIKAGKASGGAFTPEQALTHFVGHAEHYHTLMGVGAGFTWNPKVLAEFVRALMNEAEGIKREGCRQLWRRLNLAGGTQLLDALPREQLREYIVTHVEDIMSDPELVRDRTKLRNRKPTAVLSLGAGVQSSVLALMAEQGENGLSRPDFAIFADTGWEPPAVYEHLEWLKSKLSFEVVTVSAGNIRESILSGTNPENRNFLDIPVFLTNPDGTSGVATRQCTRVYKLDPIRRYLRERLQIEPKRRAPKQIQIEMWLGISADEAIRQKPSREEWITNRYPLVELDFSRHQLLNWFKERYPDRSLPASSCIGCPYHRDSMWKHLKETDPESFQDAVLVDRALRETPMTSGAIKGEAYLHRSRISLGEVDFSTVTGYDDLMAEECEGLCGI